MVRIKYFNGTTWAQSTAWRPRGSSLTTKYSLHSQTPGYNVHSLLSLWHLSSALQILLWFIVANAAFRLARRSASDRQSGGFKRSYQSRAKSNRNSWFSSGQKTKLKPPDHQPKQLLFSLLTTDRAESWYLMSIDSEDQQPLFAAAVLWRDIGAIKW